MQFLSMKLLTIAIITLVLAVFGTQILASGAQSSVAAPISAHQAQIEAAMNAR